MNLLWSQVIERLMPAALIVEQEIFTQTVTGFQNIPVIVQINVFLLYASPQSFHKNVIQAAPSSVHADLNVVCLKNARELWASEMTALIRIENFRLPGFQSVLQTFQAEINIQTTA